MKLLKLTFLTFGILVMIACNNGNKKTTEKEIYAAETPDNNMDNSADDVLNDNITINDEYLTLDTSNLKEMYPYLKMTPDQINRFEIEYNKKKNDLIDNDYYLSRDKFQKEKDNILKTILDKDQYKKYEQWKKDHPIE